MRVDEWDVELVELARYPLAPGAPIFDPSVTVERELEPALDVLLLRSARYAVLVDAGLGPLRDWFPHMADARELEDALEWGGGRADQDVEQARVTRRELLGEIADRGLQAAAVHIPGGPARVERDGDGFRWIPTPT